MFIRIISILSIPALSVVCSLMSSGIENILTASNKQWHTIPFLTWFLIWVGIWFFIYRYKFGNVKKLKRATLKLIIFVRNKYLLLTAEKRGSLNQMQQKSIQIWKELLSNKDTELLSCHYSQRRMLKSKDITIMISTANETNVMFVKYGEVSVYYDIWLPNGLISEMFNSFDKEQKNRFQRMVEESRKNITDSITF